MKAVFKTLLVAWYGRALGIRVPAWASDNSIGLGTLPQRNSDDAVAPAEEPDVELEENGVGGAGPHSVSLDADSRQNLAHHHRSTSGSIASNHRESPPQVVSATHKVMCRVYELSGSCLDIALYAGNSIVDLKKKWFQEIQSATDRTKERTRYVLPLDAYKFSFVLADKTHSLNGTILTDGRVLKDLLPQMSGQKTSEPVLAVFNIVGEHQEFRIPVSYSGAVNERKDLVFPAHDCAAGFGAAGFVGKTWNEVRQIIKGNEIVKGKFNSVLLSADTSHMLYRVEEEPLSSDEHEQNKNFLNSEDENDDARDYKTSHAKTGSGRKSSFPLLADLSNRMSTFVWDEKMGNGGAPLLERAKGILEWNCANGGDVIVDAQPSGDWISFVQHFDEEVDFAQEKWCGMFAACCQGAVSNGVRKRRRKRRIWTVKLIAELNVW